MENIGLFVAWWVQSLLDYVTPYLQKTWLLLNDYAVLRAMVLLFLSYLFAKFLSKHIPVFFLKLTERLKFSLGKDISLSLQPLILKVVFLGLATVIAKFSGLSETADFIVSSTLISLIILFIILFVIDTVKMILRFLCDTDNADAASIIQPATLPLFENIAQLILILVAVHQIFGVWHVDMTALMASAGLVGLAIGMASKDTLSDIIAGILILTDSPYRVGDIIQIDQDIGKITQIGIRNTRIVTKDNIEIIIPNDMIGRSKIINHSSSTDPSLRIQLVIQTAYGVDSEHIRQILIDVAKNSELVLQDKKIFVYLTDFQKYMTSFCLFCWIPDPSLRGKAISQLREKVYQRFVEEGIEIALPEERDIAITQQAKGQQEIAITQMPDLFAGGGKPLKKHRLNRKKL